MASRLTKSELIKVLSADPYGMKAADVLSKVGGVHALEDLIDLLQNYPDPADQMTFGLRQNIILALGEIGDPRAVALLLQCYELYGALTNLLVQTLEEKGVKVPAGYYSLELPGLDKNAGSPSLRQSAAFPAFEKKVSGTHIKSHLESEKFAVRWQVFGCLVQDRVIGALAKIKAEGMNEVLAKLLSQEREKSVCESIVLALGKLHDPRAIEGLGEYLFDFVSKTAWVPDEVRRVIDDLASYPEERAKELRNYIFDKPTFMT